MPKHIIINCNTHISKVFIDAINLYAYSAFPEGGSPCQMVSRDALLTCAAELQQSVKQQQQLVLRRRMRSIVKEALKFYFDTQSREQQGRQFSGLCQYCVDLCDGMAFNEQALQNALQQDLSVDQKS